MYDFYDKVTLDVIKEKAPNEMVIEIAEAIGAENFMILSKLIGGLNFYIPRSEVFTKGLVHEQINKEFDGANAAKLAIKYGYSERWIRSICDYKNHGQLSIYDYEE